MDVIVIGGGWGGVAAALEAASLKAETLLLERTDMLLGTGLVGGIMRNNGRFTAAEEMICLGGGKLFSLPHSCIPFFPMLKSRLCLYSTRERAISCTGVDEIFPSIVPHFCREGHPPALVFVTIL